MRWEIIGIFYPPEKIFPVPLQKWHFPLLAISQLIRGIGITEDQVAEDQKAADRASQEDAGPGVVDPMVADMVFPVVDPTVELDEEHLADQVLE